MNRFLIIHTYFLTMYVYRIAIKSLREFTPMAPFKAELLYTDPFSEDDHRESGQAECDGDMCEASHSGQVDCDGDMNEAGHEKGKSSRESHGESQAEGGNRELDLAEHKDSELILQEESEARDTLVVESDSPEGVESESSPSGTVSTSQSNCASECEASATPAKKDITTTPPRYWLCLLVWYKLTDSIF